MQIGEVYMVRIDSSPTDLTGIKHPVKGRVVYVHPKGRYATLEFRGVHGKFREAFVPRLLTHQNRLQQKK